ncbi:sensor histidine kinase [Paenibacillus sepulcri]|uniref:Sensor histidine kinase n=1 Tax=Paenibacillus sepulcri TaxID=359917 RepID=A0ABS7CAP9_9BACL|nr:sensor histidine kinase [Paenibacillus sepulcri]
MKANTSRYAAVIRYFQRSMYRKMLVSYFFIIVLTVSILVIDFYVRTAGDLKRQSIETTERLTQQSSAALNSYMSNIQNFSWNYFGDTNFQHFVKEMGKDPDSISYYSSKFSQFVNDNPIIDSVFITQLNGFSIQSGSSANDVSAEERARLIDIGEENDGKGVWVSSQTYDRPSRSSVKTITFVQAIKNITATSPGPIIGVMMYGMSYTELQKWLRNVEGNGANRSYVIRLEDGSVINGLSANVNDHILLSKKELAEIRGHTGGHFYTASKSGNLLVVYQKLANSDWILVSLSPIKVLLAPVSDFTKRTIVIGALSLLVSMLLASIFSSRTITPLKELSKGMKAIEVGNYSVSLPIRSIDEVGYLSSSFNRMAREINRLIMKVYETELVKKNAEIKSLQSQINPHFLYNTLGVIDSLSSMGGNERVSIISRSLAKMFRYNISGNDISNLGAEIQQIRLYLSIQKIRFDSRLDYSIYLEPGLEDIPIPKLLFQPLVENGVLHGISRTIEGGTIRVEVARDDMEDIQIKVWNTGEPIEPERQEWLRQLLAPGASGNDPYLERSSIGLLNVQNRLRLVYGDTYGILFESSRMRGTSFFLTIRSTLPVGGSEHEDHRP